MAYSHAVAAALDDYLGLVRPLAEPIYGLPATPAIASAALDEHRAFVTLMQERDAPAHVRALARLRWEAAIEVERLLTLLDFLDGDPDLEPSLAGKFGSGAAHSARGVLDGEIDAGEEPESDGSDDEPSFGWRSDGDQPSYWCGHADAEEREATAPERAGRGFVGGGYGEDDEGAQCDDEGAPDDNGIGDPSGCVEQGFPSAWGIRAVI